MGNKRLYIDSSRSKKTDGFGITTKELKSVTILYFMLLNFTDVLQYLNTPLMSTSRTLASTIGSVTSAAPKPTNVSTPPDAVAYIRNN